MFYAWNLRIIIFLTQYQLCIESQENMALETFHGEIKRITRFVNFLLTCENDQLARHSPSAEVIGETMVLLHVLQQKLPVIHAKMADVDSGAVATSAPSSFEE